MMLGDVLNQKRGAVRDAVKHFNMTNPRIFGDVPNSGEKGRSLCLLVDPIPGATLLDLGGLHGYLKSLLDVDVDLITPAGLCPEMQEKILSEAKPLNRLLEYIGNIDKIVAMYAGSMVSKERFLADKKMQENYYFTICVLAHNFTNILKEHVEFSSRHPDIPWECFVGIVELCGSDSYRTKATIDLELTWETMQKWLPELLKKLPALRHDAQSED